jgi:hypothetical protein
MSDSLVQKSSLQDLVGQEVTFFGRATIVKGQLCHGPDDLGPDVYEVRYKTRGQRAKVVVRSRHVDGFSNGEVWVR